MRFTGGVNIRKGEGKNICDGVLHFNVKHNYILHKITFLSITPFRETNGIKIQFFLLSVENLFFVGQMRNY